MLSKEQEDMPIHPQFAKQLFMLELVLTMDVSSRFYFLRQLNFMMMERRTKLSRPNLIILMKELRDPWFSSRSKLMSMGSLRKKDQVNGSSSIIQVNRPELFYIKSLQWKCLLRDNTPLDYSIRTLTVIVPYLKLIFGLKKNLSSLFSSDTMMNKIIMP
jgi:hypothetical protein